MKSPVQKGRAFLLVFRQGGPSRLSPYLHTSRTVTDMRLFFMRAASICSGVPFFGSFTAFSLVPIPIVLGIFDELTPCSTSHDLILAARIFDSSRLRSAVPSLLA